METGNPKRWIELFFQISFCFAVSLFTPQILEDKFTDWKFKIWHHNTPSKEIFIIRISQKEFLQIKKSISSEQVRSRRFQDEKYERPEDVFLWDSSLYEALLEKVNLFNPRAIVWSLYFPESLIQLPENSPLRDFGRRKNVVWSSRFDSEGKFFRPPLDLSPGGNFGFNNLSVQSDGSVRRFQLIMNNQLSLIARTHYVVQGNYDGLPDPHRTHWINWKGEQGSFLSCSISELLSISPQEIQNSPCKGLDGKIVLIGKTGADASVFKTPLGFMERVEVVANQLETSLEKNFIKSSPYLLKPIIALVLILITAMASLALPSLGTALVILGLAAVYLSINFLIFHFLGINLPFTFSIPAMVLAGFTLSLYRASLESQLRWKIEQENELIREVDHLKSNFISLVSHDLKTPIAKIQALGDRLLRDSSLSSDGVRVVDRILKSNEELKRYIVGMISLSRAEAGRIGLNKKPQDINSVVEEVVERHQVLAQEKGISLKKELEPLFSLEFDEDLIRQVISNLVDNAIKYSPPGTTVYIKTYEKNEWVWVEVRDEGPGVPLGEKNRIFKKFTRIEDGTHNEVKGSGLGLYLCKYFIEMHGGNIFVEESPGGGSIFKFGIPAV